jgi:hypothetical protein
MALSIFPVPAAGASSASNDFTINIGSSGFTKVELSTNFAAGSYVVTSSQNDATMDVYLVNEDGSNAGYANTSAAEFSITATKSFKFVVVYGSTTNDTLSFLFKYVFNTSASTSTDTLGSGVPPRIISLSTSNLPIINDSVVITGQNFGTNMTATFTGANSIPLNAKSITRTNATSLTVVRPDDFPVAQNPYTLELTNVGVPNPTTTNSNKAVNGVSAGASPVWVTGATLTSYFRSEAYSNQLSATDADAGSTISYSIVSGSLPTSMTLSTSGLISGTNTSNTDTASFTVRATDTGGNFLDRAFTLGGFIASGGTIEVSGTTYTHTFTSSGTFRLSTGFSINPSVLVIGGGGSGGGGASQGAGGGGGGAGQVRQTSSYGTIAGGTSMSVTVAGTAGTSTFGTLNCTGGGNGGSGGGSLSAQGGAGGNGASGGGGGGGATQGSPGPGGIGNAGFNGGTAYNGSNGGGANGNGGSGAGQGGSAGQTVTTTLLGAVAGGGGSGGGTPANIPGQGGAGIPWGGSGTSTGRGGVVVIRYTV